MGTPPLDKDQAAELMELFSSGDPDKVLDGLARILCVSTERYRRVVQIEEASGGDLNRNVTNLENSIFKNASTLAKMLAPGRFAAGPKVAINVGGGQELPQSPQRVVAEIVERFKRMGVDPDQITSQMVEMLLGRMNAIEAAPVEDDL